MEKRHICRDPEILQHFQLPDGLILLDADSRFREQADFVTVEERRVRPSWIDCIGHVNNARYGDLVYDALTPEDREKMGQLQRLDIWFLREMTLDKPFLMQRAYGENCIYVQGLLLPENKPSFVMKLSFQKDDNREPYCTILKDWIPSCSLGGLGLFPNLPPLPHIFHQPCRRGICLTSHRPPPYNFMDGHLPTQICTRSSAG